MLTAYPPRAVPGMAPADATCAARVGPTMRLVERGDGSGDASTMTTIPRDPPHRGNRPEEIMADGRRPLMPDLECRIEALFDAAVSVKSFRELAEMRLLFDQAWGNKALRLGQEAEERLNGCAAELEVERAQGHWRERLREAERIQRRRAPKVVIQHGDQMTFNIVEKEGD